MRFIHIADLHLGSSPEAEFLWGKNRAEEIWDSFAAVIDACNEKEIDLLVIAGDLFDRPPVWADLDRAAKLFARLTATEVVMIAGASDYITEDSPWKTYPWQSWVHMLSDKHCMNVQLGNINTSVHGCSYYAPTEGKPYLEDARPDKESEYQILLGYTGDDNHMPADLSELSEKGFDYIALGYEHKASVMQNMHIAYAGSLEPLSVQETGKHGFILGEINEENTTIRFVPFACREYINIKVRLSSDITEDELGLDVPRNELGHRYYTRDNIKQFLRIKELKEKGYQLRAIRDMLHSDAHGEPVNPSDTASGGKSVQPVNYPNIADQAVKQEMSGYNPAYNDELDRYNHTYRSRTADERMDEFRELMSNIVGRAIALNNEELSQQISTEVQERILKEMNYLMREQDIAQEERYKKLDAAIRGNLRRKGLFARKKNVDRPVDTKISATDTPGKKGRDKKHTHELKPVRL